MHQSFTVLIVMILVWLFRMVPQSFIALLSCFSLIACTFPSARLARREARQRQKAHNELRARQEEKSAVILQSAARKRVAQRAFERKREFQRAEAARERENFCATKLQSILRRFRCFREIQDRREKQKKKAAIVIQCIIRRKAAITMARKVRLVMEALAVARKNALESLAAIKIQRSMRQALARREVYLKRTQKKYDKVVEGSKAILHHDDENSSYRTNSSREDDDDIFFVNWAGYREASEQKSDEDKMDETKIEGELHQSESQKRTRCQRILAKEDGDGKWDEEQPHTSTQKVNKEAQEALQEASGAILLESAVRQLKSSIPLPPGSPPLQTIPTERIAAVLMLQHQFRQARQVLSPESQCSTPEMPLTKYDNERDFFSEEDEDEELEGSDT